MRSSSPQVPRCFPMHLLLHPADEQTLWRLPFRRGDSQRHQIRRGRILPRNRCRDDHLRIPPVFPGVLMQRRVAFQFHGPFVGQPRFVFHRKTGTTDEIRQLNLGFAVRAARTAHQHFSV